jgi:hypothetical protein
LIQRKEPPRTLGDVDKYLKEHQPQLGKVEIIIYANSIAAAHPAVTELVNLLDKYQIPHTQPPTYRQKRKPEGTDK